MNDRIASAIIIGGAVLVVFMIIPWIIHSRSIKQRNLPTRSEQLQIAITVGEIRDAFIAMLPNDYDSQRARNVFRRFADAAEKNNIAEDGLDELVNYFSLAVGDGDLSHAEANNIIERLDNVIIER